MRASLRAELAALAPDWTEFRGGVSPSSDSWFRQYDLPAWRALVQGGGMTEIELAHYAHDDVGWRQVQDPDTLARRAYADAGLPGASAVLCAALARS